MVSQRTHWARPYRRTALSTCPKPAAHLLGPGDVLIEYGDPTRTKWTLTEDARIINGHNNIQWIESA
jgi:hypothetical protein